MRTLIATLVLALSGGVAAQDHAGPEGEHERVFSAASQLLAWCEQEARAHYAGQGTATYQWTGRHFTSGNTLHAEGRIRVGGNDVPVACSAAQGARERHAVITIG